MLVNSGEFTQRARSLQNVGRDETGQIWPQADIPRPPTTAVSNDSMGRVNPHSPKVWTIFSNGFPTYGCFQNKGIRLT